MTNLQTTSPGTLRPEGVKPQPLAELASGIAAVPPSLEVSDIAYDSRLVTPGCLYIGLAGAKTHGASYAPQAGAAGAVAMVTDAAGAGLAGDCGLPVLVVDEPRAAMGRLAARLFGNPTSGKLTFGVTGTTGKSTISFMLDAALRAQGRHVGYIGTIGFTIDGAMIPVRRTTSTTPESPDLQAALALMAQRGADCFVMEASSGGLALDRLEGVDFDIVGFSNLGRDHLDFHKTMENYFLAKAKLFRPGWARQAVINIDDAAGRRLCGLITPGDPAVITVGSAAGADFRIIGRRLVEGRQQVTFSHAGHTSQFGLDMPGEFNAQNAMIAVAMMDAAGFPQAATLAGLAHAVAPGRMERIDLGPGAPVVFVDFGHTPEATETALLAVPRPSIAVLGAGGDRDTGKRPMMGAAAARQADIVVITDDNPRTEAAAGIRADVMAGALEQAAKSDHDVTVIDGGDRASAIKAALAMAQPGWSVAVLGRGDLEFQEVAGQLLPFRDSDVVRAAWREIAGQA